MKAYKELYALSTIIGRPAKTMAYYGHSGTDLFPRVIAANEVGDGCMPCLL